jgi:hypothetical protein
MSVIRQRSAAKQDGGFEVKDKERTKEIISGRGFKTAYWVI